MKKKSVFKIFVILIGVIIMSLAFGKVQAAEITSFLGRKNLMLAMASNTNDPIAPIDLSITQSNYKTNDGEFYWTIKDTNQLYKDLYCLNLKRGFGAPNGIINNSNSTKRYLNQYDLNNINTDYEGITGLTTANKNKILWILNNALTSSDDLLVLLNAASEKVNTSTLSELATMIPFVKNDMKLNNRNSTKLTFDDIKMVQQIAIWHYTNPGSIFDNTISGICNSNGNQISGLMEENINTDGYGTYIWNGKVKQAKLNALYQYFIDGAESGTNNTVIPELSITNTNAEVTELGSNYIVGPFKLNGTNTALIKEINATVNKSYTLLNSSKGIVNNNDFKQVIGQNFYLQIAKTNITSNVQITLNLRYTFDTRALTLLSNDADTTNTQPVVLVKPIEESKNVNTNANIELTNISVQKIWNDNNNQDGKRPTSIKVRLFKNGTKYGDDITINNSLTYTWNNLLKNDNIYTVKELSANGIEVDNNGNYNNNYKTNYQISGNNVTITNTHIPERISVSGTKTWNDENNQDAKRPSSITVNLFADGVFKESKTVTSADNWTYQFDNLDKYYNGNLINYTITENEVEDYSTQINGYNITNIYTPGKTSINGIKTWNDEYNQDGKRPSSITVNLYADGVFKESKTVTSADNWTYQFDNLNKYKDGNIINYTITEDAVAEYTTQIDGYNITNTYTPETTSKKVKKIWNDNEDYYGERPEKITVKLYKLENGEEETVDTQELNESNNWEYTWTGLNKKQNGQNIMYGVREMTIIDRYTTTYSIPDHIYINGADTITITNTYIPQTVNKKVNKVWDDNNNQDGKRLDKVTIKLYKVENGEEITLDTQELSGANNWQYTWNGLDKRKNGQDIVYGVREMTFIDRYTTIYSIPEHIYINGADAITITNIHIPERISVSGTKIWNDVNNQDGKRPSSIKINLFANGTKIKDVTVTEADNWAYKFDNLLEYENGSKINYTITEDAVAEYTTEINGYDITNTHVPEKISVSGTKTWNDANNQDGKRPSSITVNLYADAELKESKTVTSANNWSYVFENLDKYKNGNEVSYTITEEAVAEYTTEINGYDITNTHIPEKISVSGTKTWNDANNQDGKRPSSITVNLYADGELKESKTVTSANNWSYVFEDLDKYKNGNEVNYTITENAVAEYTTQINGYDITNTYTPGIISKTVIKKWEDINNQDNIRPEKVIVELYKIENSEEVTVDTQELSESNNWRYTWELDKMSNGVNIVYGIKEITAIDGYTTIYSIPDHLYNEEDTITITNTHVPNSLLFELQKIDEQNNVITSSEARFEIKGSQEITENTNNGILTLNSQQLIGNEFNFNYTIKEISAPIGYSKVQDELTVKVSGTIKVENGKYLIDTINITDKDGIALDNSKIFANYDETTNKVIIKVVNTKIENSYSIKLQKFGEDGITALENAWFRVNEGQPILLSEAGNEIANGLLNNEGELNLTYKLEETIAPTGYVKLNGQKEVKIKAEIELIDGKYELVNVELVDNIEGITISEEDNIITIKVKNKREITGKYNVELRKIDENGNILTGSKFSVNNNEYNLSTGKAIILEDTNLTSTDEIPLNYLIKEIQVPEGYEGIEDTNITIKGTVVEQENIYKILGVNGTFNGETSDENVSVNLEGNTIVISVRNNPIQKKFDLALRKFITKVNDIEYSRAPIVDTSTIPTTKTATYKHTKQPIVVQKGDVVTYTIRVYNEGEIDGYAEKITDHLPDHLLPIIIGVDGIDEEKFASEIEFNTNWGWVNLGDGKTVTTMKTSKENSDTYSLMEGYENVIDTKLNAYVEGSDELDYIDVQIKCLVTGEAISGEYLTNIAEITDAQDINGIQGDGLDSTLTNVDYSNLGNYKNNEAINSTEVSYIPGQEDDDDFEKLVVKEFDLSLRKFITKVNETTYSRAPIVDTSKLGTVENGKVITTAIYKHSKEPVIVETNDIVTYTIRIFNEGTLAGYATEITDDIPVGLEFMPNSSVNVSYRWKMIDKDGNETEDITKAVKIVTDYLSDSNNIINAVSEVEGVKTLSYKDVEVQFKVIAKAEKLKDNLIINEAQISADSERDVDSIPNRDEKYDYTTGNNEDDIDYEPIKLKYFDLALRKFITKVNTVDYNNRYPEIIYNEDRSITYNHTKDPVLVTTNDIVVYTIRIYNEGEKAGYATLVTDNLPDGLVYVSDNEVNKKYEWKLLDEQGNVTEDLSKAVKASTEYLKNEKIDAFVEENGQKILSFQDVQIAFKVVEPNTSNKILVNTAQISADSDEDIDSIPGNDILTEDDIDKEYVRVQYFDMSLKKWVTKTIVTYDGKTTTTDTGFNEDTQEIAKVDLVAKKMTKTTVKFAYNIKVTNEGELPGYVYEVKDYIPKGLKFVEEDNKDWKEAEDGIVVTDKLKDTLLNPGESATVEIVLTWKNSTTNTGLKTNYAEISNDSADDIDSTPDNFKLEEDDIDDAQVILSIKTSGAKTYIGLIFISIVIMAGGIVLIKKYVI